MRLQFLGANRQVTGSRTLLEACGKRVMIDCGLFQERAHVARNWEMPLVVPGSIDACLLTGSYWGIVGSLSESGFEVTFLDLARSESSSYRVSQALGGSLAPALVDAVRATWRPDVVFAWGEAYDSPLWQGRDDGHAYVCRNFACQLPVTDADALIAQLEG